MDSTKQVKYRTKAALKGQPIVLIGFMGCGKSTVGPLLARLGKLPFTDLDAGIEARAGRSIAKIFQSWGEARFRALETAELGRQLVKGGVIAAGGGVLKSKTNRALLKRHGAVVIWLNVSWSTLWKRLGKGVKGQRPILINQATGKSRSQKAIRELWQERCRLYRKAAQIKISVTAAEPRARTAHRIFARLKTVEPARTKRAEQLL